MAKQRFFITGTDTDAGKTYVSVQQRDRGYAQWGLSRSQQVLRW